MTRTGDFTLRLDLQSGELTPLPELTLQSVGLRERDDLQRWITTYPQLIGPDLLLITSEFNQWEIREQRVADRLDVLFLDATGALVIGELKRDRATDTVDMQALKYAAYCSQLTVSDIVEEFARYHGVPRDGAYESIHAHAPSLADGELGQTKIRLVAGSFGPAVTTVVLWLYERGIDIGCVEVTARGAEGNTAIISARQLLPLPEAEDYLVRRRRREQAEEVVRQERASGPGTLGILAEAGLLRAEDTLTLGIETLTSSWREPVQNWLDENPAGCRAKWIGTAGAKSLRWEHDREVYSATGLVKHILALAGIESGAIAGPDHWLLPDGRAMYRASLDVRAERGDSLPPSYA